MSTRTLLLACALVPLTGAAQELDYTFVEMSYLSNELDAGPASVDGDGLGLKGSLAVSDSVFLFANYATQDYDFGVDASNYDLGAGMRWGLKPNLDLVGEAAWVHMEVEAGGFEFDDDGLGLGIGLRSRLNDSFELQGGMRYVDLEGSDTFLSFGGRYYFTNAIAAGFGLDLNDDTTGWNLGIRAEFGN